jgi:HEPN domain-containing protein
VPKTHEEWLRQAEYDMETAQAMFDAGRYFYAVFMCHLSIEKALKGLVLARIGEIPPKTHSLVYLLEKLRLSPPQETADFVFTLNRVSVLTRYPEEMERLQEEFPESRTKWILQQGREALRWLRTQLPTP